MIAKEKADIAFQMLLQVRNKMMDAYEEVKQIRV
jgi:flagellar hook-basal body complex protein FliE